MKRKWDNKALNETFYENKEQEIQLGVRVPEEAIDNIREIMEIQGISKKKVVMRALDDLFDKLLKKRKRK